MRRPSYEELQRAVYEAHVQLTVMRTMRDALGGVPVPVSRALDAATEAVARVNASELRTPREVVALEFDAMWSSVAYGHVYLRSDDDVAFGVPATEEQRARLVQAGMTDGFVIARIEIEAVK